MFCEEREVGRGKVTVPSPREWYFIVVMCLFSCLWWCSGDRSVPCVIRQPISSPDYLWVYDSSCMFYRMIVYCCVCVTVVVTDDVSCCISDGDCCCVVVLCAWGAPLLLIIVPSDLGSLPIIVDIITANRITGCSWCYVCGSAWYSRVQNHWSLINKRSVLYALFTTDHREIQDATMVRVKNGSGAQEDSSDAVRRVHNNFMI
jgi:hypothetical protein